MKFLITLLCCGCVFNCFSQKNYVFDYAIAYDLTTYKTATNKKTKLVHNSSTTKVQRHYYLTNSKDNSYLAVLTEKDSLYYTLELKDYNGVYSKVLFLKSEFNIAEIAKLKCENVSVYKNFDSYQTKNYDFNNLQDTLINTIQHKRYQLKSNNPKRTDRKKLATDYYILMPSTDFHLPILWFATAYEEWKLNKSIPNGIFKERYMVDYYGTISFHERYINSAKINKTIQIDKDCNYIRKTLIIR